jgi:hypothetical protein
MSQALEERQLAENGTALTDGTRVVGNPEVGLLKRRYGM